MCVSQKGKWGKVDMFLCGLASFFSKVNISLILVERMVIGDLIKLMFFFSTSGTH